jgi:hypothetical protein
VDCGGSFAISTFTAEKTTEPAIDKALEVLNKLHKMVSMKNHWLLLKLCKGQFPTYETTEQQASLLTQMFWYNFEKSFINNFEKMLTAWIWQKLTKLLLNISYRCLQFVLVGKADEIRNIAIW